MTYRIKDMIGPYISVMPFNYITNSHQSHLSICIILKKLKDRVRRFLLHLALSVLKHKQLRTLDAQTLYYTIPNSPFKFNLPSSYTIM